MFDDEKELNSQDNDRQEEIDNTTPKNTATSDNSNNNEENFISDEKQESAHSEGYYQSGANHGSQNSYYDGSENNGNTQQTSGGGTYYSQNDGYNGNGGYNNSYENGTGYRQGEKGFQSQNSYYNSGNNYYNNNNNNNKDKGKKTAAIVSAIVVSVAVIMAGICMIISSLKENADKTFEQIGKENTKSETKEYPTIGSTVTDRDDDADTSAGGVIITDVSNVVDDVMPSIVAITSTTIVESQNFDSYWPFGRYGDNYGQKEQEEVGAGSGIIVKQTDTELLIVTNNHVVSGADSLSIQFVNGTSINGLTKSTDEDADIAIVSIALSDIDNDTLKSIKIATLGSSDELKVGEGVVAIGNALGYGQSVTTGVISAKEREISVDDKTMTVLQTDAAINGGNSGGALINGKGEVIGINVAKYSSSSYSGIASVEGMGFAIPISQATDIINNLMTKQTRNKVDEKEKGALGIQGVDVDSTVSAMYSLPQGIYIKEVIKGGAAEKAGLRATDVITKFDGQSLSSMAGLQEKLAYYKAGETVTITVQRNANGVYSETEVEITLSASSILQQETTK